MTTQAAAHPLLHLVRQPTVMDGFDNLFIQVERDAKEVAAIAVLNLDAAWTLAQYVDLVDAGHGDGQGALYRGAAVRLAAFVQVNFNRPEVRALCRRTACLSAHFARLLDEQCQPSGLAVAQALAA